MNRVLSVFSAIVVGATILLLTLLPTAAFTRMIAVSAMLAAVAYVATTLLAQPDNPSGLPTPHRAAGSGAGRAIPWAAAALGLFWLLTVIPLPAALSAAGNAHRREQNQIVQDTLVSIQSLELIPSTPARFAISRNTTGTVRYALMMLAAFAIAMLVTQVSPPGKIALLRFLILLGAVVAIAGCWSLRHAPQGDTLWWVYSVPHSLPGPVACFRNRNHFAAFLALLCPAALALVVHDLTRLRLIRAATSLAALACLSVGIVLSLSRGAMLAWACGLTASLLVFAAHRRWRVVLALVLLGVVCGGAALAMLPPEARERLATLRDLRETDSYQKRVEAWRESAGIVRTYPWFGAGANAFRIVYPQHRVSTQGALRTHAENEYVQWIVDCGIFGTALLLWLGFVAWRGAAWPALRPSNGPALRDRSATVIGVASLGGIAVAAAHATVDYALHIPLYTLTAAALAGLIVPRLPPAPIDRQRLGSAAPAGIILIVASAMSLGWGRYLAFDEPRVLSGASRRQLASAMGWAPPSPHAWYCMADRLKRAATPESNLLARQALHRAMRLDPNNYRLINDAGYAFQELGDSASARAAFARVRELRDWMFVPDIPEK